MTCNNFDTIYRQWNELSINIPKNIRKTTLTVFYSNYKHLGTVLPVEEMVAYKTKVCEKFNERKNRSNI